ncbi:MAG: hypothetical protein FWH10_08105 [Oscillospiraceae bacterium]|nr:hypothetical protein [Oscillospiraceae bacterium]
MNRIARIIKTSDKFIVSHKNKIALCSLIYIFICYVIYFAVSGDRVYTKIIVLFLISTAFLAAFYGIKSLLNLRNKLRNKFMPLNLTAGYTADISCIIPTVLIIIACLYDFILTFDGFNLIILSVFSAILNAVISARVKNLKK